MKKKRVHRNGRNLSAPWPPMAGRATLSRMNRTIASNRFMNQPRLTGFRAACRASGMITAATRTAATTSISMNRVIWHAEQVRQVDLDPVRTLPVGELQGGVIHHMAHAGCGRVLQAWCHRPGWLDPTISQAHGPGRRVSPSRREPSGWLRPSSPRGRPEGCASSRPRIRGPHPPPSPRGSSPTSDPAPTPARGGNANSSPTVVIRDAHSIPTDKAERRSGGGTYHSHVPRPSRGRTTPHPAPGGGNGESRSIGGFTEARPS